MATTYKIVTVDTSKAPPAAPFAGMREILTAGTRIDVLSAPPEAAPGLRIGSSTADRIPLDRVTSLTAGGTGFPGFYVDWSPFVGSIVLQVSNGDLQTEPVRSAARGPRWMQWDWEVQGDWPISRPLWVDLGGTGSKVAVHVVPENSPVPGTLISVRAANASSDPAALVGFREILTRPAPANGPFYEVFEVPYRYVAIVANNPLNAVVTISAQVP